MGPVGVQEMVVIFLVALVLFGPKKLPELGKTIGKAITEFRRAQSELKATFEGHMRELEKENESIKEVTRSYTNDIYNSFTEYDSSYSDSGARHPRVEPIHCCKSIHRKRTRTSGRRIDRVSRGTREWNRAAEQHVGSTSQTAREPAGRARIPFGQQLVRNSQAWTTRSREYRLPRQKNRLKSARRRRRPAKPLEAPSVEVIPASAAPPAFLPRLLRRPKRRTPEDEEEQGMLRMSFMEHLEELRGRIIRALYGLAVAFVVSMVYCYKLWDIIEEPAVARPEDPARRPAGLDSDHSHGRLLHHLGEAAVAVLGLPGLSLDRLSGLGLHRSRPI